MNTLVPEPGFRAPAFPGSTYIPAIFGAAVYLYGGWVFLAGGVRELRDPASLVSPACFA